MSPRASHRRLPEEGGFTIVEVLVAALILTVTALAIATLMNSATHNTFRSEQDHKTRWSAYASSRSIRWHSRQSR
jgi:Tfp pilus assembly protein PilV